MKKRIAFAIIVLFVSCTKKETNTETSTIDTPHMQILSNYSPENAEEYTAGIMDVIDFKLGDAIKLDSPKKFIQITILYTLSQYSNYSELIKKNPDISDDQLSEFLTQKRKEFHNQLGISESDYIQYSVDNAIAIQDFLSTNQKFEYAYELSISQVIE